MCQFCTVALRFTASNPSTSQLLTVEQFSTKIISQPVLEKTPRQKAVQGMISRLKLKE